MLLPTLKLIELFVHTLHAMNESPIFAIQLTRDHTDMQPSLSIGERENIL